MPDFDDEIIENTDLEEEIYAGDVLKSFSELRKNLQMYNRVLRKEEILKAEETPAEYKQLYNDIFELFSEIFPIIEKLINIQPEDNTVKLGHDMTEFQRILNGQLKGKVREALSQSAHLYEKDHKNYYHIYSLTANLNASLKSIDNIIDFKNPDDPIVFDEKGLDEAKALLNAANQKNDRILNELKQFTENILKSVPDETEDAKKFKKILVDAVNSLNGEVRDYTNEIEEFALIHKEDSIFHLNDKFGSKANARKFYAENVKNTGESMREVCEMPVRDALRTIRLASEHYLDRLVEQNANENVIETLKQLHQYTCDNLADPDYPQPASYVAPDQDSVAAARKWYKEFVSVLKNSGIDLSTTLGRMRVRVASDYSENDLKALEVYHTSFYDYKFGDPKTIKEYYNALQACENHSRSAFMNKSNAERYMGFTSFDFEKGKKLDELIIPTDKLKDADILSLYRNFKAGRVYLMTEDPNSQSLGDMLRFFVEDKDGRCALTERYSDMYKQWTGVSTTAFLGAEFKEEKMKDYAEKHNLTEKSLQSIKQTQATLLHAIPSEKLHINNFKTFCDPNSGKREFIRQTNSVRIGEANFNTVGWLKRMSRIFPDCFDKEEKIRKQTEYAYLSEKRNQGIPLTEDERKTLGNISVYTDSTMSWIDSMKTKLDYKSFYEMLNDAEILDLNGEKMFMQKPENSVAYVSAILNELKSSKKIYVNGVAVGIVQLINPDGSTSEVLDTGKEKKQQKKVLSDQVAQLKKAFAKNGQEQYGILMEQELDRIADNQARAIFHRQDYFEFMALKLGMDTCMMVSPDLSGQFLNDEAFRTRLKEQIMNSNAFEAATKDLTLSEIVNLSSLLFSENASSPAIKETYTARLTQFQEILDNNTNSGPEIFTTSDIYKAVQGELDDYIENADKMNLWERVDSLERTMMLIDKYQSGKSEKDLEKEYTRDRYDGMTSLKNEIQGILKVQKSMAQLCDQGLASKQEYPILSEEALEQRKRKIDHVHRHTGFSARLFAEHLVLSKGIPMTIKELHEQTERLMNVPEFEILSIRLKSKPVSFNKMDGYARVAMEVRTQLNKLRRLKTTDDPETKRRVLEEVKNSVIRNTGGRNFYRHMKLYMKAEIADQAARLGLKAYVPEADAQQNEMENNRQPDHPVRN